MAERGVQAVGPGTGAWARRAGALLLALAAGAAAAALPDPVLEARVARLSEELRCLVCRNQSLADSDAELARDLKRELREQLAAGRSEGEVRDYLVQRYGDFVLYRPPLKASTALLWIAPLLLPLAGLAVLWSRWRRARGEDDEDAAPVQGGEGAA
ncbi:cytochrome c-type biogenesis protein [uncultured Azohydromonas sp.]|uniref:cytochrome c-type biogenesis protein n=1 Tax=uncultured Azohydromonas sp. TaxID=487342 RepID=UPI00345C22B2